MTDTDQPRLVHRFANGAIRPFHYFEAEDRLVPVVSGADGPITHELFQPIAPIRPEAPRVSLLTVARTLPAGTEWRSGISFLPNGCEEAQGWPNCYIDPSPPVKAQQRRQAAASFAPFPFFVPDGCDLAPFYAEDWEGRGRDALTAYTPWAMSRELDTGALTGNPSLRSTATDLAVVASIDVTSAVDRLLRARVEAGFGGIATLHVPAWLIPGFLTAYLLSDAAASDLGGMLRVSPGPGYTGVGPNDTGNIVPGAREGYIYITGPVEYELSPIVVAPSQGEQNRLTNNVEMIAERFGILRFDPCGVFAVLANDSCCTAIA